MDVVVDLVCDADPVDAECRRVGGQHGGRHGVGDGVAIAAGVVLHEFVFRLGGIGHETCRVVVTAGAGIAGVEREAFTAEPEVVLLPPPGCQNHACSNSPLSGSSTDCVLPIVFSA